MKYINDILDVILDAAQGAFLQVGVFVGAVLFIFGYINFKTQGKFIQKLVDAKKYQPIIGALMGLTPGCGGAIFMMPLYLKGKVSYGTVIATLLATMGDAAFVLIATNIKAYALISAVCFGVALVSGYAVDGIINKNNIIIRKIPPKSNANEISKEIESKLRKNSYNSTPIHKLTHTWLYRVYWAIIIIGLVLGILMLCQIDIDADLLLPNLGLYVGVVGTLFSVVYTILQKKFIVNDTMDEEEEKTFSLKNTLIHNAEETAFVILWVFVAYLAYDVGVELIGGERALRALMLSSGFISVIIGATIGLIPGCGPQIIFASLYAKGMLPLAALVANAISQDGDALLPLLVVDRRSSIIATIVTTIPAIIVGALWYFIQSLIG